jgi:hypothetical protein
MSDSLTTPRALTVAQLADFLVAEAAERQADAPALAEQLMDLARQAAGVYRPAPAFTRAQRLEIYETVAMLRTIAHEAMLIDATWSLPTVSVAERQRWGVTIQINRAAGRRLIVTSTVPGYERIGQADIHLHAEQIALAFVLACRVVESRTVALTPPPAAPAMRARNNRQLIQQYTDQLQNLARRAA